jgi:hypothetical protein
LLDAFAPLSFEQALGAAEPSGRRTCLTPKEKTQADPKRATGSAQTLLGIKEDTMGSIERPQMFLFATDQIRRHRQQFEIVGSQRDCTIGEREGVVVVAPSPLLIMLSAAFEVIESFREGFVRFALIGWLMRFPPAAAGV